jgi:hypothetical protein
VGSMKFVFLSYFTYCIISNVGLQTLDDRSICRYRVKIVWDFDLTEPRTVASVNEC